MQRADIRAAGIGHPANVLRGLWDRGESFRPKAAYYARLPFGLQQAISSRYGRQIFTDTNHSRRAIWIHIPKNAGTSICDALGFDNIGHQPIVRYAAQDQAATRNYFKFAIARNPWDRLHSSFTYLRRHPMGATYPDGIFTDRHLREFDSFESFVHALADDREKARLLEYTHFLPQTFWLTLPGQTKLCVDHVGRFEDLAESFGTLAARFGYTGALPELNRGEKQDWRVLYTSGMRDIVAEIYAADIAAFGYTFDSQGLVQ